MPVGIDDEANAVGLWKPNSGQPLTAGFSFAMENVENVCVFLEGGASVGGIAHFGKRTEKASR
jgi:hypothetical protein